jgi:hypothetical protein
MKQSSLHHTLIGAILLLAIVACVLPSQTTPLPPETNPNLIETAVVGTAQAVEQKTEQANLFLPTATVVPTDTMMPTPKISSAGTSLLSLADGSTQFTDYRAGTQILFPSIWLVFRIGELEYYAAWEKHNLGSLEGFAAMQNIDPNVLRVAALEMRSGQLPDRLVTALTVIHLADDRSSLEEWEQERRDRHNPCVGFKFISSSYPQTNNGTRYLLLEESCNAVEGGTILFRDVYFSLPSGTLHVNFETNFDEKDITLPEFDQVVNNLTLINP